MHLITRHRSGLAAVASLALTAATLSTAAPALAKPTLRAVVTTTTIGNKPGAGCPEGGSGKNLPDGTTVTQVFTLSDGTQTSTTSECRNGQWFTVRVGGVPRLPVPVEPPVIAPTT
jgi:hypothetical protein